MPIRRSLLSVLCLLALSSASTYSQQSDPFAEWDRLNGRNASSQVDQRSPKKSMTYFSPQAAASDSGAEAMPKPTAGQPRAAVPMRERSADSADSKIGTPASQSVLTAPGKVPLRNSSRQSASPLRTAASTASKPTPDRQQTGGTGTDHTAESAVRHASFNSAAEGGNGEKIQQLSHSKSAVTGAAAEENPFAEFLEQQQQMSDKEQAGSPAGLPGSGESSETEFGTHGSSASGAASTSKDVAPQPSKVVESNGLQSPGVTVEWVRHGNLNVGQLCTVELVVRNTSQSVLRSVMTEAAVPSDVEIVEANPRPMAGIDVPTWTFGELQAGEKRSVTMKVIPKQRGAVRLDAFVRLTGYSSASFAAEEPMIGIALTGPETVQVGEQVSYLVRVSNPGTGVAGNVMIQAAVPEGLEHRSGSLISIDIGTLNPGESRQARLNLTAVKGGSQDLAVRAIADGGLGDQTAARVAVAEPKLKIAITGPSEQMAERTSDYVLSVGNAGNVPSSNVRAKYRLPTGLEYVAADRGGKYSEADHSIEWFVGTLRSGESSEFRLSLRGKSTGQALHQAGVISEHGQVTMCEHITNVEGSAALDLKIAASAPEFRTGQEVTWTVTISNTGSRAASNVGISCELPSGISLISAIGPSEYIAENGVMVFRSLEALQAGKSAVFKIKARCTREGNHRLRLRVASESIAEPLIGEESATVLDR